MSSVTLQEIAVMTGGRVIGDGTRQIVGVCDPEAPKPDKLSVVWKQSILDSIPADMPVLSEIGSLAGRVGVEVAVPRVALAAILAYFDKRRPSWSGIHPTAFVADDVQLGSGVTIGPLCVISPGCRIGDGVVMQAQVFLSAGVTVGEGTTIDAGAVLQDGTVVGRHVKIHSGAVLGSDGFGFVPDGKGSWIHIPQIGTVVIEDHVEIGAQTTIDRATYGETVIKRGTKLGNLVHIAHNCVVGEDCLLVGMVGLGGSVQVGDHSLLAGSSAVADHINIGERVTIAGRSGVTKNVPDGMTVSGFPAQEHRREARLQAELRGVPRLAERVRRLEKECGRENYDEKE